MLGGKGNPGSAQSSDGQLHGIAVGRNQNTIKPYLGNAENAHEKSFSNHTYNVLAGSFIKKFFTETHNFKLTPLGDKINYFNMNKSIYK